MRLDRYVLKEMVVPFFIGMIAILMLFQGNSYVYIAQGYEHANLTAVEKFRWVALVTPGYMNMTLPVGMSLATSLAITRITREGELTAIRAAGCRILRVVLPVFLLGILVGIADFQIMERVVPKTSKQAADLERKGNSFDTSTIKANALLKIGPYMASIGSVTKQPNGTLDATDLLLIQATGPQRCRVVTSRTGHYEKGAWALDTPSTYDLEGTQMVNLSAGPAPGQMSIPSDVSVDALVNQSNNQAATIMQNRVDEPISELRKKIAGMQHMGIDPKPAQIELCERYSAPAACAVFAVTSCAFAIMFGRLGGFVGVLISFMMVGLFYNFFVISTEILGRMDFVSPWMAAWMPDIVFGLIGLVVLARLE